VEIRQTKLAEGIYQFTSDDDGSVANLNSVAVINEHDVLLFDTQTRPSSARVILTKIRALTDKPVRYVVNSHWHPDHWSGNEVFTEAFAGLEIIATEEAAEYMHNVAPAWVARFRTNQARLRADLEKAVSTGKRADGSAYTVERRQQDESDLKRFEDFIAEAEKGRRTYPTLTYRDHLRLRHGGREFEFISIAGDAVGTTILYLPKEKMLFAGDAVVHPIPYSTPPPSQRIAALRKIATMDVAVLVPGHGPAMRDMKYVALMAELLEQVMAQVRTALRNGAANLDEVQKAVKLDELGARFAGKDAGLKERFDGHVQFLVRQAIRELREQDYQQ
jgi:glyoxylase-like metal-dependent hydrolase (beta-lactamase superfamily II)